jgi:hypothetical protein
MNDLVRWLLDLNSLRFGQKGVEFGFARPIPAWGWALVVVGAVTLAAWSYRRLEGSRAGRVSLAIARSLLLIALVVLIAGPRLVKPNETEEKDWVLVLADRSASMGIKDAPPASAPDESPTPGSQPPRISREQQLEGALVAGAPVWNELARERVLLWMGFDSGAFELKASAGAGEKSAGEPGESAGALPVQLGEPAGRRTALGRSLEQALRRAAARPVSGIVLLSDGRSIDEPSRAILRRLQAEHIPVFTVPLGSAEPVADLAIRRAECPRTAFVNDFVPVEVEVERLGAPAATVGERAAKVQLVDQATGIVLDERPVTWPAPSPAPAHPDGAPAPAPPAPATTVTLTTKAGEAGKSRWGVRLIPGGPDLVAENNTADVAIELLDRPLHVAYYDGYPRWEQRYLKWLLVREKSMEASTLILSSGRRYVQEGQDSLISLPRSPEEWRQYDVVIIGDVRPEVFTTEQLEQIKEHVAVRGAGLIWIGGEGATPLAWRGTPLEDLLPFSITESPDSPASGLRAWGVPVNVRPTPLAERLGVLRLSSEAQAAAEGGAGGADAGAHAFWPRALSDPAVGWSRLYWAQRIDAATLKPTAEVLAEAIASAAGAPQSADEPTPGAPAAGTGGGAGAGGAMQSSPLVVSMRFGAGRVLYVATDEIWRWRYGRGEFLPERFWLQMIRLLGRESLSRSGKAARLEASPRRAEVEQPLRISVELLDQSLVDAAPLSVKVRIIREGSVDPGARPRPTDDEAAPIELVLLPEGGAVSTPTSGPAKRATRMLAGTWLATESGRYRIEVADPLIASVAGTAGGGLATQVEIWLPEDELRHPETDHALLARLSQATVGQLLTPDRLGELPRLLHKRRLRLAGEPEIETLWDTPLSLIVVVVLLTAEWIGRRLIKLA